MLAYELRLMEMRPTKDEFHLVGIMTYITGGLGGETTYRWKEVAMPIYRQGDFPAGGTGGQEYDDWIAIVLFRSSD